MSNPSSIVLRKTASVLCALLLCVQLTAQDSQASAGLPRLGFERDYMTVFGSYTAGSTMLSNAFLNSFYRGDFLDAAKKANAAERANPYNHLGVTAEAGYSWRWRTKWKQTPPDTASYDEILLYIPNRKPRRCLEHDVTYRERFLLTAGFTPDAFTLAFEGNRPFIGSTAVLDNTQFTSLRWQELHYGIDFWDQAHALNFGVGLSVLNGQQFSQLQMKTGSIYTAPLLNAIDVAANANWAQSDTNQTGWGITNGLGATVSLRMHYRWSEVLELDASVTDLGGIRWSDKSLNYRRDSAFSYTGIDISNAVLDPDAVNGLPEADDITGPASNNAVTTWLPAHIVFRVTSIPKPSANQIRWGWTLQGWMGNKVAPQQTFWASYQLLARVHAQTGLSFGGFSRFQAPFEVAVKIWHIHVQAGTPNLLAFVLPKHTTGQGLWLSLGYQFGRP